MRSRLGAMIAVAVLMLAGVGALAAPAGAQTEFSCSYVVGPTVLPPGGGFITVRGTAPGTSVVRVFANGKLVAVTDSAPISGEFSVDIFVTGSVEISVALDDYPNTPCIGTGSGSGGNGANGGSGSSGVKVGTLPRTGSSDTGTFVLLGLGAVSLGLVLVVAARRRSSVHSQV